MGKELKPFVGKTCRYLSNMKSTILNVKYGLAYSFSQVIPERLRINHRGRKNTERKTDSSGKTYHLHSSRGCQLVPNSGVEKFMPLF
jgi:hypothetical protein